MKLFLFSDFLLQRFSVSILVFIRHLIDSFVSNKVDGLDAYLNGYYGSYLLSFCFRITLRRSYKTFAEQN